MRTVSFLAARWSSPAERRARSSLPDSASAPHDAGLRVRPEPGALYDELETLFDAGDLPELMRALDG